MGEKVVFDYATKYMLINSGETEIDVVVDLYSDAKEDWLTDATLNKFRFPFRTVGGDPTVGTQTVEPYFFLQYGWRVKPQEADHNLVLTGNLFVDGGGNPLVPTSGEHTVLATQITTITRVSTSISGEIQASLSTEEHNQLMSLPDLSGIEGSTVLAKQATSNYISGEILDLETQVVNLDGNVDAVISELDFISGEIGVVHVNLLRALGLMQENYYLDNTTYTTYNGQKLLTGGRVRVYDDASNVGTGSGVLSTYNITANWNNDELQIYQVLKQP